MVGLLRNLWSDDAGLILSAELVIILTIAVLGMVVGLVNLQHALLGEFTDLGLAFQSLNQSYSTPSYRGCWKSWGRTSWVAGSCFVDVFDGCVGTTASGCTDTVGATGYQLPATQGQCLPDATISTTPSTTIKTAPQATGVPSGTGTPCPALPVPCTP